MTMKPRRAEDESRHRIIFLFFMLLLQFAALSGDSTLYLTVRQGDDMTLPCENVADDHNCDTISWLYKDSIKSKETPLIEQGKISEDRLDRLSVAPNCALVLKKVRAEDVGRYACRQCRTEKKTGRNSLVHLSVVTVTEHQDQDWITLNCSVLTHQRCKHKVRWLFEGKGLERDHQVITESCSSCIAVIKIQRNHCIYPSDLNLFTCEVKRENDKGQFFILSSDTQESRSTGLKCPTLTTVSLRKDNIKPGSSTLKPVEKKSAAETGPLWLYITVSVVILVIIITVSVVIIMKKSKKGKIHQTKNDVDPEESVSYASVSYTKKPNGTNGIKNYDGDAVTYSTLKPSSTDPSSI